jgi:hypothetical protein
VGPVLALILLAAAGCGPVPGGELSGEVRPPPADWTALTSGIGGICEIESRPGDSHSIQLQCYEHESKLYVHSHRWALASWYPFESWPAIWIEHPEVRVRFGDAIYELFAERVGGGERRSRVLESRGYDPVPDGVVLFQLRARRATDARAPAPR